MFGPTVGKGETAVGAISALGSWTDNLTQSAAGLKGEIGRKAGEVGKPIISLIYLKDLILALTISGIGLLGYGLHLLLANVLNPAAAAIATACLFGVVLFVLRQGILRRLSGR